MLEFADWIQKRPQLRDLRLDDALALFKKDQEIEEDLPSVADLSADAAFADAGQSAAPNGIGD
jgi:hypothetical protein